MIKTVEAFKCEYCRTLLNKVEGRYIVINGRVYCNLDFLGQEKTLIAKDEELVFCSPDHLKRYLDTFL